MKIKPADIEIPECEPFRHDLLDRKRTAKTLTNLLQNLESPYTLSIDSSWGNGKTTFLNMWKQHLVNEGFPVVGFNAWETDFTGSPLVALSSELINALECHEVKHDLKLDTFRDKTRSLFRVILPKVIPGAISLLGLVVSTDMNNPYAAHAANTAAAAASDTLEDRKNDKTKADPPEPITYLDTKNEINSFKTELQAIASTLSLKHNQKPLIIAIDELDRCRPSYAVELLEIAKHFFSVDNIVFVLAIDRSQLTHAIKSLYGNEFDSIGYLRRFIDLDFRLPDPDRTRFVVQLLDETGILNHLESNRIPYHGPSYEIRDLLSTFLNLPTLSLRRIQQAMLRLGLVLSSIELPSHLSFSSITLMIILKTIDPTIYYRFIHSDITDKEASNHVFDLPGLQSLRLGKMGAMLDALLIIADSELRTKNKMHPKPAEISLHNRCLEITTAHPSDPALKSHAELVLNLYEQYNTLHKQTMENHLVGFEIATRQIELFSTFLLNHDA